MKIKIFGTYFAGILGIVLMMSLVVVPVVGYVLNIVKFAKLDFQEPYKAEIIRGIGLTPIGAIIGYIKLEDGIEQHD